MKTHLLPALMMAAGVFWTPAGALAQGEKGQDQPATNQPAPKQPTPKPATENLVYVVMKTSMGDIILELNREKAPISVENFLQYADRKFYDGTVFHRIIPDFMIQGGGFTPDIAQKRDTAQPIKNEWKNGLKNVRGSIAMARLSHRHDSATCQFFINVKDNPDLDNGSDGAGYAVFGSVAEGMDVVDKIKRVKTGARPTAQGSMQDVPVEAVVIKEVRRLTAEETEAMKSRLGKS